MIANSYLTTEVCFRDACVDAPAGSQRLQDELNQNRFVLFTSIQDLWDDDMGLCTASRFPARPTKRQIRKAVKQFKCGCSL